MPAAMGMAVASSQHNWKFVSEPEPHMHNRRMAHPRGKLLGGSEFWDVVRRTVTFTVVAVVLSVLIGLAIALLMRRVSPSVRVARMTVAVTS